MAILHRLVSFCLVTCGIVVPLSAEAQEGPTVERPATALQGSAPGEVRDDNALQLKLVWCPAGFFEMESLDQRIVLTESDAEGDEPGAADVAVVETRVVPVKVFLTRGYWLGKYEVTQQEWKQIAETTPWKGNPQTKEGDDFPATHVGWNEAMEFCRRLTTQERAAGRLPADWEYTLPTEAQWERACRARSETKFCFGEDPAQLADYAWYDKSIQGEMFPHRVGLKQPNAWGLHDMHGNLWEWCRDRHVDKLPGGRDPEVTVSREMEVRMNRGGSWANPASSCRSSLRSRSQTRFRNEFLGFRVALCRASVAKTTDP